MKKKTYVFNEKVLSSLEEIKKLTNKKETQILEEAIMLYLEYLNGKNSIIDDIKKITDNLNEIISKVEELSYKLGKCEAEREFLRKELNKS